MTKNDVRGLGKAGTEVPKMIDNQKHYDDVEEFWKEFCEPRPLRNPRLWLSVAGLILLTIFLVIMIVR